MGIFTEDAFKSLDTIYGNFSSGSSAKKNWSIPTGVMQNSDLQSMLQCEEIQSVLNAPKSTDTCKRSAKKNPLTNIRAMLKLNPNVAGEKRAAWRAEKAVVSKKAKTEEVVICKKAKTGKLKSRQRDLLVSFTSVQTMTVP